MGCPDLRYRYCSDTYLLDGQSLVCDLLKGSATENTIYRGLPVFARIVRKGSVADCSWIVTDKSGRSIITEVRMNRVCRKEIK